MGRSLGRSLAAGPIRGWELEGNDCREGLSGIPSGVISTPNCGAGGLDNRDHAAIDFCIVIA